MKIGYRIVIITALLVFISYFFLFEIEKRDNIIERAQNYILTSTDTKNNAFSVPKPEEDTFKQYTLKTSAWIPYWDEERGFKIFYDNIDKIDSVSPVWFYANSDGTLTQRKNASSVKNYVDRVHDLGGEIIPTITNPSEESYLTLLIIQLY